LRINLETAQINTAIAKHLLKVVADGIGTQPTDEGDRRTKPGQCTGHVGRSTAKAIITILKVGCGWVTTQWSEPVNESLTETNHLRRGIGHQACSGYQQRGQKSCGRQAAQQAFCAACESRTVR
tara:strand:- start:718 stop:1089 length:372 start_codon:yes stop_codon:yes gene_type:complete